MSVAVSASTGSDWPRLYTATLSGMPWTASQPTSTPPSSPPSCSGDTLTEYAGWPAIVVGVAPVMVATEDSCEIAWPIEPTIGGIPLPDSAGLGSPLTGSR